MLIVTRTGAAVTSLGSTVMSIPKGIASAVMKVLKAVADVGIFVFNKLTFNYFSAPRSKVPPAELPPSANKTANAMTPQVNPTPILPKTEPSTTNKTATSSETVTVEDMEDGVLVYNSPETEPSRTGEVAAEALVAVMGALTTAANTTPAQAFTALSTVTTDAASGVMASATTLTSNAATAAKNTAIEVGTAAVDKGKQVATHAYQGAASFTAAAYSRAYATGRTALSSLYAYVPSIPGYSTTANV